MPQTQCVLGSGRNSAFSYLIGHGKSSTTRPSTVGSQTLLHCYAPSCPFVLQTQFVLGSGRSNGFGYLIGYGKSSPTRPQHRLASCTKDGACGVAAGLMAQAANPVQLKGKPTVTNMRPAATLCHLCHSSACQALEFKLTHRRISQLHQGWSMRCGSWAHGPGSKPTLIER